MKKLRNRIYLSLLPLQLLLVGLAVWTFFLLSHLDALVDQTRTSQLELGESMEEAMIQLHELEILINLAGKSQKATLREDIIEAQNRYLASFAKIEDNPHLDQDSYAMRELESVHRLLGPRLQALVDNLPQTTDDRTEVLELIVRTDNLLGNVSTLALNDILILQESFRQRIKQSFYVLSIGIVLGVLGTILISYQIGRNVVYPLESLEAKLLEVTDGNYDAEVRLERADEIGHLATAYNRMVRSLRVYRNITDRRLNRTTQAFQSVLQRSLHPILFLSDQLEIYYGNPQADELLGAPEFKDGLPEELRAIAVETLERRNILVHRQLHEALRIKVRGQPRFYLVACYPVDLVAAIPDAKDDTANGIALTLQDVTKMKLADNIKGNLVATVSHELKTPLTSARMALYLLSEQQIGPLNADQADLVDAAIEDLERQLATIQNLLDLSRIESGQFELAMEPCLLSDTIELSVAIHRDLASASDVEIIIDGVEDEPEIKADPKRLVVVLNNFISNAIRHSPHGSAITIETRVHGSAIRCAVCDQGEGIDPELQPRLFERYSQGKQPNTGSAGLGLHISKTIIDQHNGEIGYEAAPDCGSSFYFTLPVFTG